MIEKLSAVIWCRLRESAIHSDLFICTRSCTQMAGQFPNCARVWSCRWACSRRGAL